VYGLHIGDTFWSELQVNGLKHLVFTRLAPQKRMVAQVEVTSHGVEGVAIELQHVNISEEESVIGFVLHEKQGPSFSYYTVEHINHCCMKKASDVTLCNLNIVGKNMVVKKLLQEVGLSTFCAKVGIKLIHIEIIFQVHAQSK
jgi:hypothetical protein